MKSKISQLVLLLLLSVSTSYAQFVTSVVASQASPTSETVTWTTNAASSSLVYYAPVLLTSLGDCDLDTYGVSTVKDPTLVTSHSVSVTGLTTGVSYHFCVQSIDTNGAIANSVDGVFTTAGVAPAVSLNPVSATVCVGSTATFTAAATGVAAPSIQWRQSIDNGVSYQDIVGAISPTLSFTAIATQTGYRYKAVFTNASGTATSTAAILTVNTVPVITLQPMNVSVAVGANASFTSTATGTPSPTLQWQQSTDGGLNWTDIGGATSSPLTVTSVTLGQNGYQYRATYTTASCAVVTSSAVTLTVTTSQSYSLSYSAGSNHSGGAFLQGATLSGSKFIWTSLKSDATNFSPTGITQVCFYLDSSSTAVACDTVVPYDYYTTYSPVSFVQMKAGPSSTTTVSSVSNSFTSSQSAGNLNVVVVTWADSHTISSVVDTHSNTYAQIGATQVNGTLHQAYYYAKNIASGPDTITVTFSGATLGPEFKAVEYKGLDQISPLDVSVGTTGTGTLASTGNVAITSFPELLVAGGASNTAFSGAGAGYTSRVINLGNILEDQFVTTLGNYGATAVNGNAAWDILLATFRAAYGPVALDTTTLPNGTHSITQVVTKIGASSPAGSVNVACSGACPGGAGGVINLTNLGTSDWAHWGRAAVTSFDHKNVTSLISNWTQVGTSTNTQFYSNNWYGFTWTDGTPTATATNTTTGVFSTGLNSGFTFTVPADTTTRTLTVYVDAFNCKGQMVAHISDASAPDYIDTSVAPALSQTGQGVYTFVYSAKSAGQTLRITWTDIQDNAGGSNVAIEAATLATGSSGVETDTSTFTVTNTATAHSAALTWVAGAASNPVTYNIYRGTVTGGPYTRIASGVGSTNYTDTTVVSGTTYYYVVQEVDNVTTLTSGFSNQVTAVIP